jgi:hypothetical protein
MLSGLPGANGTWVCVLTAQRDRASKPTVPSMRTSDARGDESKRSTNNVRQDDCWFRSFVMLVLTIR